MRIEEVCELVAHWEVQPAGVREALHLCPNACEVMLPRSVYDGGSPPEPTGLLLHFALFWNQRPQCHAVHCEQSGKSHSFPLRQIHPGPGAPVLPAREFVASRE